MIEGIS